LATNTSNFNLVKPAQDDFYDIDVHNGNMDIIDAELKKSKDHIANTSNPHSVTKSQVGLGNVPNVATNDQTPTYTTASANTALTSGEKLSVAFGKIAKAVSSLISHLANTSNPHSVTKSQVGLGSVPNVATNDQTPTYSDTTTLATLVSGEKLGVAFPKIKLAITNLINHLANKSNPHAVTKSQVGLGNVENKSSATIRGEITSANVTTALGYTPPKQDTVYTLPTGNASTIGGVKLSDSTSSSSAAASGVAATPKAVKAAYDLANAALPKAGGTISGAFQIQRTMSDGTVVRTNAYPYNYALNSEFVTSLIHSRDDVQKMMFLFNETGAALYDLTTGTLYPIYSAKNKPTADELDVLSRAGGTLRSALVFDKGVDNGYARIIKNHSATADYGLNLNDFDADDNVAKLIVSAKNNKLTFSTTDGSIYEVFHEGHKPTATEVGLGNVTNKKQMPIAGGTFTGNAKAYATNRAGECLRNIDVRDSTGVTSQSTNFIRFDRKG